MMEVNNARIWKTKHCRLRTNSLEIIFLKNITCTSSFFRKISCRQNFSDLLKLLLAHLKINNLHQKISQAAVLCHSCFQIKSRTIKKTEIKISNQQNVYTKIGFIAKIQNSAQTIKIAKLSAVQLLLCLVIEVSFSQILAFINIAWKEIFNCSAGDSGRLANRIMIVRKSIRR